MNIAALRIQGYIPKKVQVAQPARHEGNVSGRNKRRFPGAGLKEPAIELEGSPD